MELLEVINKRRSIRSFAKQPVDRELLLSLVRSAVQAPSAKNLQAWRFIIVDDPGAVREITAASPGIRGNPPAIIAVCSDYGYAAARSSGTNYRLYGCVMDASMASENLMLAAVDAGLGTCAIKSYTEAAVRKVLKLPEDIHLEILITVGYPEGEARTVVKNPAEEVTRFNTWENLG